MQTTVVNYFDELTNEHVATKYYIRSDEVNFDQYMKLIEKLIPNDSDVEDQEIEDEEYSSCCRCDDTELTDEDKEIIDIIESFAENIEQLVEECTCGSGLRNNLIQLLEIGMDLGFEQAKEQMKEFIDS